MPSCLPCSAHVVAVERADAGERVLTAYRHAVEQRYRFFSYGDFLLIQ